MLVDRCVFVWLLHIVLVLRLLVVPLPRIPPVTYSHHVPSLFDRYPAFLETLSACSNSVAGPPGSIHVSESLRSSFVSCPSSSCQTAGPVPFLVVLDDDDSGNTPTYSPPATHSPQDGCTDIETLDAVQVPNTKLMVLVASDSAETEHTNFKTSTVIGRSITALRIEEQEILVELINCSMSDYEYYWFGLSLITYYIFFYHLPLSFCQATSHQNQTHSL